MKAKFLEKLITNTGLSFKDFSDKCGIPYTSLYTILKYGLEKADAEQLSSICNTLGISVEQLNEMSRDINVPELLYADLKQLLIRNVKHLSMDEKFELIKILRGF